VKATAEELAVFVEKYGYQVFNALENQASHMAKAAEYAQAAYDKIKDDPEARAVQDATLITTEGLRQSARRFTEEVRRATLAAQAWDELTYSDGRMW
jgi:hypothetical protein